MFLIRWPIGRLILLLNFVFSPRSPKRSVEVQKAVDAIERFIEEEDIPVDSQEFDEYSDLLEDLSQYPDWIDFYFGEMRNQWEAGEIEIIDKWIVKNTNQPGNAASCFMPAHLATRPEPFSPKISGYN